MEFLCYEINKALLKYFWNLINQNSIHNTVVDKDNLL